MSSKGDFYSIKNNKKHCKECNQWLALDKFGKASRKCGCRLSSYCKECRRKKEKIVRETYPDRCAKAVRKYMLKKKYGLSLEAFEKLLEKQNGKCAICNMTTAESCYENLCIDHDHKTGKVRGLLCPSCNVGIGNLKHSVALFNKAISYIKKGGLN